MLGLLQKAGAARVQKQAVCHGCVPCVAGSRQARRMSDAEEALAHQLDTAGIDYVRELVFAKPRRFRFDFALTSHRIAIEVEGGGWSGGRHTRGAGFQSDLKKYELAVRSGWTVYRCDPAMVTSGGAMDTIRILIKIKEGGIESLGNSVGETNDAREIVKRKRNPAIRADKAKSSHL